MGEVNVVGKALFFFCNLVVVVFPFPLCTSQCGFQWFVIFRKLIVSVVNQSSNLRRTNRKSIHFRAKLHSRTFTYTISQMQWKFHKTHCAIKRYREKWKLNSIELNAIRAPSPSHFFPV